MNNSNTTNVLAATERSHPKKIRISVIRGERYQDAIYLQGSSSSLTGLARFLSERVKNTTNYRGSFMVRCYNGLTEHDMMMKDWLTPVFHGENDDSIYSINNLMFSGTKEEAIKRINRISWAYSSHQKPCLIEDWKFGLAKHDDTFSSYWNTQARVMINAGVEMVKISDPSNGKSVYFVEESEK